MTDDVVELGGNIQLSGFKDIDKINNQVINKIVGNYTRKFRETCENFEMLKLHLKKIHRTENSNNTKIELHAKLTDNGKLFTSEVVERNLYFALDAVLKKIEAEIRR